jgi:hypothetical protein
LGEVSAAKKGTWVRIFQPPVESRLRDGFEGVDIGERLKVKLVRTDVQKGYIDSKKIQWSLRLTTQQLGSPQEAGSS